jgi:hypothetical protein
MRHCIGSLCLLPEADALWEKYREESGELPSPLGVILGVRKGRERLTVGN